ncbi:MAG TPA: HAD family hydrolase [Candidatus Limnocylindria bacterium]|jgi:phosphoglycolate phosphatase|nr:HAD family hydrolase [Candidatus Limnocylindria bacterium]
MRYLRGRLAGVSVRASFGAGAWVGAAIGIAIGAVLGALISWFAGTVLAWQRDLAFTLGVARTLLPLGDQVAALRWLSNTWYLVIPITAAVVAVFVGIVGGFIGALLAAAYNRSPRHASVVVELPDEEGATAAGILPDMSTRLPTPDAVVFDLDGTLVDTVAARIAAWQAVFAEEGIETTAPELAPLIGIDGRRLAREVAAAHGRDLTDADAERIDQRAGQLFDERNHDPRALPGAAGILARLDVAGVTWAIATSSREEQVHASVAALGLDEPPRVVNGSRVAHAKPAPDLLLLAARELHVDPGATWYVGDSTWDMQAARAAGMSAVGVLAGAAVGADALEAAGATLIIETLDDLVL